MSCQRAGAQQRPTRPCFELRRVQDPDVCLNSTLEIIEGAREFLEPDECKLACRHPEPVIKASMRPKLAQGKI